MVLQEPACGSKTLLQDMQEAYEKGLVSEEAITEAVERLMEVRIRLGMMKDYPSPYEDITYDKVECPEHVKLSVEAARRMRSCRWIKIRYRPSQSSVRMRIQEMRWSETMSEPLPVIS